MNNIDVVNEVRILLFHFMKEYGKLEDNSHIANPAMIDNNAIDYLSRVKNLFREFEDEVGSLGLTTMTMIDIRDKK